MYGRGEELPLKFSVKVVDFRPDSLQVTLKKA